MLVKIAIIAALIAILAYKPSVHYAQISCEHTTPYKDLEYEILKFERLVKEIEPKIEWYREYAERVVGEGPLTNEAEEAVSYYGDLLMSLNNAKEKLAYMKRELNHYETEEITHNE